MRLLLIRHARAEACHHLPDAERPLTDEGRSEFARLARDVVERGVTPGFIFHSPARRTSETASILAAACGLPPHTLEIAPWLALESGCQDVLPKLAQLPAALTALVGHEPIMSSLTSLLMRSGRVSFSPGTSACLEFDKVIEVGQGRLLWMLEPR